MSEGIGPAPPGKDPVVRFLIGCAAVTAALLVLVILAVGVIGWNLTRDTSPRGRAEEVFFTGDERRYWCLDLKPDDPGLVALAGHMDDASNAAREKALEGSPLRLFPFPRRRNELGQVLPLKLELAAADDGWSARGSFAKGAFKVRAAVKFMRWVGAGVTRREASGVEVTVIEDRRSGHSVAIAMVGNRLLVASDGPRLEKALATPEGATRALDPRIDALHATIRLDGEDGWAFGPDTVASFDVNARDELRFRVTAASEREMDAEQALSLARSVLPYVPEDAIHLDSDAPSRGEDGRTLVTGYVDDLANRIGGMILRFSASQAEKRHGTQSPSASPSPPSPRP